MVYNPSLLSMISSGKSFALILILIMAVPFLSLLMVKPAFAQSVPTPSVPQFTVKFVNASYSVTTTNAYTGKNETQQVSNNSIEIAIKNQQFDYSNNGLTYQTYFNVRAKPHFADNWTELYSLENLTSSNNNGVFSWAEYIDNSLPQSNSSYTISSFPVVATEIYGASGYDIQTYYNGNDNRNSGYAPFMTAIPYGAQIDFQVQAYIGHNSTYWYVQHPFYPTIGGFPQPAVAFDIASGWSSAQTVTIGQTSPTLSPTQALPEFPVLVLVPMLLFVLSVAVIVRHRKTHNFFLTN